MCGLAGYVGVSAEYGPPLLRRMAGVMAHRGPDGEGFWTGELVGLAHRRLAIIDREGGEQPMRSPDGRYVLVYNGEVYNFRDLRTELETLGHEFTTHSDTEVVLAAWAQWGPKSLDRLNGMFAFAVADTTTGDVTLVRDQFGIKPMYLAEDGDGRVVFASEIRPILATGVVERRPDDVTLYRYLRFRVHDDTERTFFAGVSRLLPGQLAVLTPDGKVRRETYTSLYTDLRRLAAAPGPYDAAAKERFAAGLRKAIRDRLVSDVPVGTALSGGLDSSTIVTTINELLGESDREAKAVGAQQQTFSAVFPGEINDEERFVDAVADTCHESLAVHKVRPNADQFLDDLLDFVRTQEEPVISTGPYAQYCVMREAGQHVTVMIDGQGADEMMAGYLPYYLVALRQARRRAGTGQAVRDLASSRDVLWRLGRFRVKDTLSRRKQVPVTGLLNPEFVAAHRGERFDVVPDDLKRRLEDDIFRHSLQSLLRYEDRNTMRFSVEGRVPFLDADLLRTLWALDDTAILDAGWNKRALRDATGKLLPPLVHGRRDKIGFTAPEESWFKRIKNYVYEVFSGASFGNRPYFDQVEVVRAFEAYLQGRSSAATMTFWRMLNVELWLREFIDNDPNAEAALVPDAAEEETKTDYAANEGKHLLLAPNDDWARFPLRVDLVGKGDDVAALATRRLGEFFTGLADAPPDATALAAGRWYLFVSEKIVAIAQGRSFFTWDIHPKLPARVLSRFVVRTPWGIGLGHPTTMQLAIDDVGLPRIFAASAVSAVGKVVGKRGWFYKVAGPSVRAIDGPTQYSAFPANVSAKLAPADPAGEARKISAAVRAALPAGVVARFGGTVVIDANDIGRNVLGQDSDLTDDAAAEAFRDNPLGQGRQQTPLAVVVRQH